MATTDLPVIADADTGYGNALYVMRTVREFDCSLIVNMAEGGKTPLLPASELEALGFRLVIFPGSLYRAAVPAMHRVLDEIKRTAITQGMLDQLLSFEARNQITGLARHYDLERRFLSRTGV